MLSKNGLLIVYGNSWEFGYKQLNSWNCKFHKLICGKEKGSFDLVIDDKSVKIEDILDKKIGFTCGSFDLLHPGHVTMLKDCKKRISLEAGITLGWEKFTGINGLSIGINEFGESAPGNILFEEFGFTTDEVVKKATQLIKWEHSKI